MKISFCVLLLTLVLASTLAMNIARRPHNKAALAHLRRRNGALQSLGNFFHRVSSAVGRRDADDDWIDGGNTPGKRCLNTWDDSCINGNLPSASSDDSWMNGGENPGKRCLNTFDESCANGGLPNSNTDDDWNDYNGPGKR